MSKIKTAGDLRSFLADVLLDIRSGGIEADQANAISKVAAQINNSLAVEVNTALRLASMGKDQPVAGSMAIGGPSEFETPAIESPDDIAGTFCTQCDKRVSQAHINACGSRFCKAK